MHTREDIFNTLRDALVELFEIEPERRKPIYIPIWKSTASTPSI